MSYWLIKSEPSSYSIDDMARDKSADWTGIRNYQARNFIREMKPSDICLFYHSGGEEKGIYGLVKVMSSAKPDETQFKRSDSHFDPKSTEEKPIWYSVEVKFVEKFIAPVYLSEIKRDPQLSGMVVAQQGSRLSVQPVSPPHYEHIIKLAHRK
jgi:predicted RNA-binding protein with PUA-like domain